MSVFTTVTAPQLEVWLRQYPVGELESLQGILSGIENTNYFVNTRTGRFVLTLFERLAPAELAYYLDLMAHLAARGIECPCPVPDNQRRYLGQLNGKPAALVTRLSGAPVLEPQARHCEVVGEALARLHRAGQDYPGHLDNLRGAPWWQSVAPRIHGFLDVEQADLLREEIRYQSTQELASLPRGVVHADLFRDNVLFEEDRIGGLIDFYFACNDVLVYDIAITLNDWCTDGDGALEPARARALLRGYQSVRSLSPEERLRLPAMLRAGALRFWVSRLYDYHLPRPGELTHAHDPERFRRILTNHIHSEAACVASLC